MTELVKSRTAAFTSETHKAKFKGYLERYQEYANNFPSEIFPLKYLVNFYRKPFLRKTSGLGMRFILDIGASGVAGAYNPQRSDFPRP